MIIINIISTLIIIYIALYFFYYMYVVYCASKSKIKEIEERDYDSTAINSFNIIVYSHNNEPTISTLLESIKNQEYSDSKVNINIILDNCTDNSSKVLEIIGGAKIWRVNSEGKAKGKNYSIQWLLERIMLSDNSDAYIFLSPEVSVKPDFLDKVNKELSRNDSVTGITLAKNTLNSTISQIISLRKFFKNSILHNGRNIAGFTNQLSSDVFAIKKDAFKKIEYIFDNNSSYEYQIPLKLMQNDIKNKLALNIRVYKQYQDNTETLLKNFNKVTVAKLQLLKENFKILFDKNTNIKTKEYLISAIYPSEFVIAISCIFVTNFAYNYGYWLGPFLPNFIMNCYIIAAIFTAFTHRLSIKKTLNWVLWIIFSPIALVGNFALNYRPILGLEDDKEDDKDINRLSSNSKMVDVTLTDGGKELACQIEIITEDSLSQVVFWFNDKKMSSDKKLRITDAIQEVSEKLMEHGFALKICQNCGYFEQENSGRANTECGSCYITVVNQERNTPERTQIWSCCEKIIPSHAKEFVKKELDKLSSSEMN